VKVID